MATSTLNVIKTYAQVFLCAHQEQLDRCGVVLLQRVFQPLPADRKRRLDTNCRTTKRAAQDKHAYLTWEKEPISLTSNAMITTETEDP